MRKRRRAIEESGWKAARKCVFFFTTICVIPVVLVLLVTTDNYMRPERSQQMLISQRDNLNNRANFGLFNEKLNLSAISRRLRQRQRHLASRCKTLGLDIPGSDPLHKANAWEYLVDKKHKLVWCAVFKAASTSWMYNFNILAGFDAAFLRKAMNIPPLALARKRYPRVSLDELRRALNESLSFIIVRHPLERLLSAYRDKLEYSLPHSHHRKLSREIAAKYKAKFRTAKQRITMRIKDPYMATFREFVAYLLDCVKNGEKLDMHWTPIAQFCTPCMFRYDVIAHTETLMEDQTYLIKRAKLEKLIKPQWKNGARLTTDRHIKEYYAQLTRSEIIQLYHVYRYDFELFNYTLDGYLELGKADEDPSTLLAAITLKDFPEFRNNQAPRVY